MSQPTLKSHTPVEASATTTFQDLSKQSIDVSTNYREIAYGSTIHPVPASPDFDAPLSDQETSTAGDSVSREPTPKPSPSVRQESAAWVGFTGFNDRALVLFDRLDLDQDGYLSKDDLAGAVTDPQYTNQDAQVIAALYREADSLSQFSNDEWGKETTGVSRADLVEFRKFSDALEKASNFRTVDRKILEDISRAANTDNNDFLTREELEAYRHGLESLARPLSADEERHRRMISFAIDNFELLESLSDDQFGADSAGISTSDAKMFGERGLYQRGTPISRPHEVTSVTQQSQRQGICYDLYANPGHPEKVIAPEAICQGRIGNSSFLSVLMAVANSNPTLIKNMIHDNHDGTYVVSFPGDRERPVCVKSPTEAEMGLFNGGSAYGTWAIIMEKAYGAYRLQNDNPLVLRMRPEARMAAEGGIGVGREASALELLTGQAKSNYVVSSDRTEEIRSILEEKFCKGLKMPVTTCPDFTPLMGIDKPTASGFCNRNSYTIIDYDPNGPDGGWVVIQNPQNGKSGTPEGKMIISLKQYLDEFNYLQG